MDRLPPSAFPVNLLLFGGSFDPVHSGHLAMAAHALLRLELDRVLFLPARRSPLKPQPPRASDAERLHWLQLATAGIPWAQVSDFELHRTDPSHSWQTVQWAQLRWPGARLHWLIGADQWRELDRWVRSDWLHQHLGWVICGRAGGPLSPRPGVRARFLPGFAHPASSTELRRQLAAGEEAPAGWLPPLAAPSIRASAAYRPLRAD